MTHIGVFDKALKATWINRIFHGKKERRGLDSSILPR